MKRRSIILCADDFGQSAAISAGILDLAEVGRLSAVSCLATGRNLAASAPALLGLAEQVDIGLHLSLTDFPTLTSIEALSRHGEPAGLARVIYLALADKLDRELVLAEFRRQLDRFEEVFGRLPDFVDGHQHVHVLPGIRGAVTQLIEEREGWKPYIRSVGRGETAPFPALDEVAKVAVLGLLSHGFDDVLDRAGLPRNDAFRGLHGFDGQDDLAAAYRRFDRWMRAPGRRLLIACHPGRPGESSWEDSIAATRVVEHAALGSRGMEVLMEQAGVRVARFAECFDSAD